MKRVHISRKFTILIEHIHTIHVISRVLEFWYMLSHFLIYNDLSVIEDTGVYIWICV